MQVQTFRAPHLQEAVALVRRRLGAHASILESRLVHIAAPAAAPSGGPTVLVEVTAIAHPLPPDFAGGTPYGDAWLDPAAPGTRATAAAASPRLLDRRAAAAAFDPDTVPLPAPPPAEALERQRELDMWYTRLVARGLSAPTAEQLLDQVAMLLSQRMPAARDVRAALRQLMAARMPAAAPLVVPSEGRRVVALVGPAGEGKSTVGLALAHGFAAQRKVALLRIGESSARGCSPGTAPQPSPIPTFTASSWLTALAQFGPQLQSCQLVVLDTAPVMPRQTRVLQQQREILGRGTEIHLALSAASLVAEPRLWEPYARAGATRLVLTRLELLSKLGTVWDTLQHVKLPLSFLARASGSPELPNLRPGEELVELLLE